MNDLPSFAIRAATQHALSWRVDGVERLAMRMDVPHRGSGCPGALA